MIVYVANNCPQKERMRLLRALRFSRKEIGEMTKNNDSMTNENLVEIFRKWREL